MRSLANIERNIQKDGDIRKEKALFGKIRNRIGSDPVAESLVGHCGIDESVAKNDFSGGNGREDHRVDMRSTILEKKGKFFSGRQSVTKFLAGEIEKRFPCFDHVMSTGPK